MIRSKWMILLVLLLLVLAACGAPVAGPVAEELPMAATLSGADGAVDTAVAAQSLPAPVVDVVQQNDRGETAVAVSLAASPGTALTAAEVESLNFMREEEKLAHDVYVALYEMWGLPVFQNIAASELNHTESVLRVMETYGLPDLAQGNPAGVFTDPTLQSLYDQMIAQGSQSLLAALRVGATIEEVDILDLQARLAQTGNADITRVYQGLLSGSENHLRSFAGMIERQAGEIYTPQYLSLEAYNAIMTGQNGRNGQGQADGGMGGGQSGQSQPGSGQGFAGGGRWGGGRTTQP